jgi:hypothetical protein
LPAAPRFTGAALVRLLSRLTDAQAPASRHAFPDRLTDWIGWTDAIALAAALHEPPGHVRQGAASADAIVAIATDAARVRDALARSIDQDFAPPAAAKPSRKAVEPAPREPADRKGDLAEWRRRHASKQQTMEAAIRAVRGRVRDAMAGLSPDMARLAGVDTVMERVLGEQERTLLSLVPKWLERRHDRRIDAAEWNDPMRRDVLDLLHAELDLRWQPVEGLLDALRAAPPSPHP